MTVTLLILDEEQRRWLVQTNGQLPCVEMGEESPRGGLTAVVQEALGLTTRQLFCPYRTKETQLVVLERLGPVPSHLHWSDDLGPLAEHERAAVTSAQQPHPLRVPWAYPGWQDGVLTWLSEVVGEPITTVEPVRTWSLSCLVRANTKQGLVYFKATNLLPLFCNEPLVTQRLAERFPGRVPLPLGIDPTRGWMALADFGPALKDLPECGGARDALRVLGELQRTCLGDEARLLSLGLVDRRVAHFAQEVPLLLQDQTCVGELTDEERAALYAIDWKARLSWLAELPNSLVHGDPHTGNVAPTATGFQLFDWSDASVAPPWMDLLDLLFNDNLHEASALWAAHAAALGIEVPWETLAPLVALYHSVSYRHIAQGIEPTVGHEHGGIIPFLLRKVLGFVQMQKSTP